MRENFTGSTAVSDFAGSLSDRQSDKLQRKQREYVCLIF